MLYIEVIENLKSSVLDKKKSDLFKPSIDTLKENFGISITTEFIKSIVGMNNRKIQNRIYYLLNENGFKQYGIIKPTTTEKTILKDVCVENYTYRELSLENNTKNSKNPNFKQFFKDCGDLCFIEKTKQSHNIQTLNSYKIAVEKVFNQII